MPVTQPSSRVWLITGTSSGFGHALACYALNKGDIVVATMRNTAIAAASLTSNYSEYVRTGKLLVLELDVTNAREIAEVFKTVKSKYGRIDIVFNNAGYAVIGEIEGFPEDKARALFDTNFWGAANVSREAVKCFRESSPQGGRLLQHSASSALDCNPGVGYFGASKAALESFTEALSQEIDPKWNIKITIIESGPFNTGIIDDNKTTVLPAHPAYTSPTLGANPVRAWRNGEVQRIAGSPNKAAMIFYRLSKMDKPPFRLPLHAVSIASAKARIESLQKGIDGYASWSDEIF